MPVSLDIRTPLAEEAALFKVAAEWLCWVDGLFSTYRPGSQVSRIGRGELDPRRAHPAVREVIDHCDRLAVLTGGYFSVLATGQFDPSGYVKGWAAERLSRHLAGRGAVDHCLNLGGDIRVRGSAVTPDSGRYTARLAPLRLAGGPAAPGTPWRIGVRDAAGRIVRVVTAGDLAIATSGGYERGPHIVDPVAGRPARSLASVTVVGGQLGLADGLATALFAGADAVRLVGRLPPGYGFLLVDPDGRGRSSDGFRRVTAAGQAVVGPAVACRISDSGPVSLFRGRDRP